MVADIGRIVAGATKPGNFGQLKVVVETGDACNVNVRPVEHFLTAGDRPALSGFFVPALKAQPWVVEVKDIGIERSFAGIFSERIICADEELEKLPRKRNRTTGRTTVIKIAGLFIRDL